MLANPKNMLKTGLMSMAFMLGLGVEVSKAETYKINDIVLAKPGQMLLVEAAPKSIGKHRLIGETNNPNRFKKAYVRAADRIKIVSDEFRYRFKAYYYGLNLETGMRVRIPKESVLKHLPLKQLSPLDPIFVFQKKQLKSFSDFSLTFTPGEYYPVVAYPNDAQYTLKVDVVGKLFGANTIGELKMDDDPQPAYGYVDVMSSYGVYLDGIKTSGIASEVYLPDRAVFEKSCGSQRVTKQSVKFHAGAKAGLSFEKIWGLVTASIYGGVDFESVSEDVLSYGAEKYYSSYTVRRGTNFILVDTIRDCRDNRNEYLIKLPYQQQISINQDWARNHQVDVNERTGKILVTCAKVYHDAVAALEESGMRYKDAAVFLSHFADWKGFQASCS